MDMPGNDKRNAAAEAARELAAVRAQLEQARAELARVRADVITAESHSGSLQVQQLIEANEQLVLSALRAQADADTAAQALSEGSRRAELDALTQLPNRQLLLDRLAQAIAGAKRRHTRTALLFVDLNGFKQVNDTLGHAVGDQMLKLAAARLVSAVRGADTVSRHGGDEFVVLLAEVGDAGDAAAAADKVSAALAAPSRVADHVIRLTASIGISLYPDDGEEADTLIDRADAAMYRAKRQGLRSAAFGRHDSVQHPAASSAALQSLRQPVAGCEQAGVEHRAHYARLREANQQLVLAALDAQELQAAAERALARQKEVLALVAHELRNPLTPIRSAAALLAGGRVDEPLLRRAREIIERQVTHLHRLVGDLVDVSRADTGKLSLRRETVDVAHVIDDAVRCCRPSMDARLQRFRVVVSSDPLLVDGDPVRLTQVLCNLLDNASKYTPVGGEIGLAVTAADGTVTMQVSDDGIGITAEALLRIFDPFVQERHAIGCNASGLGIGLTVVRELVQAHGGRVDASSAGTGLGSQFVVTLPSTAP